MIRCRRSRQTQKPLLAKNHRILRKGRIAGSAPRLPLSLGGSELPHNTCLRGGQWCIAKNGRWVYAKGRGEGPEGTLLICDHWGEYTLSKKPGCWYTPYTRVYLPIHYCVGPTNFTPKMASRSVQPFCKTHGRVQQTLRPRYIFVMRCGLKTDIGGSSLTGSTAPRLCTSLCWKHQSP